MATRQDEPASPASPATLPAGETRGASNGRIARIEAPRWDRISPEEETKRTDTNGRDQTFTDKQGISLKDDERVISYSAHRYLPSTNKEWYDGPPLPIIDRSHTPYTQSPRFPISAHQYASFFDSDSSPEGPNTPARGATFGAGLILPRTPLTPGLVITPATDAEGDSMGLDVPRSPSSLRPENGKGKGSVKMKLPLAKGRARAGSKGGLPLERELESDSSPAPASENSTSSQSEFGTSNPSPTLVTPLPQPKTLKSKKSFSEKLSSLRPLLTVNSGLPSMPRRSTDSRPRLQTVISPESSYSPSPSLTESTTQLGFGSSPTRSSPGTTTPLLSPSFWSRASPSATESTPGGLRSPLASPLSGGGRWSGTKGGEDVYVVQLANGRTSPESVSPAVQGSVSNEYPDLVITGQRGEVFVGRADLERDRLELVRITEGRTPIDGRSPVGYDGSPFVTRESKRVDPVLATMSSTGGLSAGVRAGQNGSLGRDVITIRAPFLRWTCSVDHDGAYDGGRTARMKRIKVVMGARPGCLGNHTLVTPDSMFEWAQTSTLTKCIDVASKVTVAKLHSRMFKDDKLVISAGAESLGPMLLLSACKIWWEQSAKKDFRTTA